MKAAFIERHGGPEVLKFGEMPDPVAASGEVLVDIVAASVNGADWKVREGKSNQLSQFPYILGRDFSGVVSALGADVGDLRVGDEVFAVCDVGQEGAYAEKIAIKAAIVAKKNRLSVACRCRCAGACRVDGNLHHRRHVKTEGGRDDPDPGRSGRRRELCHTAGKTSRCARDHDRKRVEP